MWADLCACVPEQGEAEIPVAQQQRAGGNLLRLEEAADDVVEVPGTAGDVEDRVARAPRAVAQRAIEGRDSREGQPGARVLQEHHARGPEEAGDLRLEHGVVHVADDAVVGRGRRQENRRDRRGTRRVRRVEQLEPHPAPRLDRGSGVRVEPLAHEPLVVGHDLAIAAGKGDAHAGARQWIALQALEHREQVAGLAVPHVGRGESLVFVHPREQQDAPRTAVAAVRRHVVRVAVHQPLQRVRAAADPRRERGRELLQLLPPPVADIGSWIGIARIS